MSWFLSVGKLHSQFGLLYTSLGMFDEAIQSFEKALPLVRAGKTTASLQMEASILQNIGAAYNEKGLYSEGVIYHREAANLHSKCTWTLRALYRSIFSRDILISP